MVGVMNIMVDEKIICSRCGAEMKKSQRCCMKCGNINYSHPENAAMLKYANNGVNNNNYVVGNGSVNVANTATITNTNVKTSLDSNFNYVVSPFIGNKITCVIVNFCLFILLIIRLFLALYNTGDNVIDILISMEFLTYFSGFAFLFLSIISLQFLYMKANKPWWFFWIPIYNLYVFYDIALEKGWLFIFNLLPSIFNGILGALSLKTGMLSTAMFVVSIVVNAIALFNLGRKFGYSGLLSVLFFPIEVIVMAFNTATSYDGVYYVSEDSNLATGKLSKDYKINRFVLILFGAIIFIGVCGIFYCVYSG